MRYGLKRRVIHRRKWFRSFFGSLLCLTMLACGVYAVPLRAQAYFGVDEDYILRTEKPEPGHYFEFVNGDDSYTVQAGDTLWEIAKKYYGSGTKYQKLWEDNREQIDTPETLQIGTKLKVSERLYTGVGMLDYTDRNVLPDGALQWSNAWEWDPDSYSNRRYYSSYDYELFPHEIYPSELGELDPYQNWEDFQAEVIGCSRRLCGDRVSDLTFARYQVNGYQVPEGCRLCYYQFTFAGDKNDYVIMVSFAYTDTAQVEGFAVCDRDKCSMEDLAEAKGKVLYKLIRPMPYELFCVKKSDYVGAEDWSYPQLHNPFTQAMDSFCDGPLERVEDFPGDHALTWKEPAMEELVREEMTRLWQLTEEEQERFAGRPVMASDLAAVETLKMYVDQRKKKVFLQLNSDDDEKIGGGLEKEGDIVAQGELTTLDDLRNFFALEKADIHLNSSSVKDFSSLGELESLWSLHLGLQNMQVKLENEDMAFLGQLKNLRLFSLEGWDDYGDSRFTWKPTKTYEGITDLSVLRECPHLTYLTLATGNVENYDFLGELPDLYFLLLAGHPDMKNVEPDRSILPDGCIVITKYYDD